MSLLVNYILPFLVILTMIVFVHEFGHYLAARYNGVKVEVFSIGFGREILGFTDKHGTRWKFSLVPLGGYIKMLGDADSSREPSILSPEEHTLSFRNKKLVQRVTIAAAGPGMNFCFSILVFTIVFMSVGQPITQPVVGEVKPGSAAEEAGILPGDRFISIDGEFIEQFSDIHQHLQLFNGSPLTVQLKRGIFDKEIFVTPRVVEDVDYLGNVKRAPVLGISVDPDQPTGTRYHTLYSALTQALHETYEVTHITLTAFGQMVTGARPPNELSGILRIAHFSGLAAREGIPAFVMFIAILSINLGIVNLFPIPLLDGGYLLFCLIEGLQGKPLNERVQEVSLRLGLVLVFCLMVFATWNDVVQLRVWDLLVRLVS